MSEESVILYTCSGCGKKHHDQDQFRRFIGNVNVPNRGGLIGNNIWDPGDDVPEDRLPETLYIKDSDGCPRITYLDYCLPCVKRILL